MGDAGMHEVKSILFDAMRVGARVRYGDASTRPAPARSRAASTTLAEPVVLYRINTFAPGEFYPRSLIVGVDASFCFAVVHEHGAGDGDVVRRAAFSARGKRDVMSARAQHGGV